MLEKLLKSILAAVMCTAGNLLSGTIRFAADIHSACSRVKKVIDAVHRAEAPSIDLDE